MGRREEQPWESRATVVLDTRDHAHRGEGPAASFEWAVSAAASIAVHLRQAGYKLRLVTGSGVDVDATELGGEGVVLDTLADVKLTQADHLHGAAVVALLHAGWRSVPVGHGADLPALWPQAARGSQGFAWRAAM